MRPAGAGPQFVGQLLHLAAGWGIDDARSGLFLQQLRDLPQAPVAVADGVADIGPVEPGDDQPVFRYAELGP